MTQRRLFDDEETFAQLRDYADGVIAAREAGHAYLAHLFASAAVATVDRARRGYGNPR